MRSTIWLMLGGCVVSSPAETSTPWTAVATDLPSTIDTDPPVLTDSPEPTADTGRTCTPKALPGSAGAPPFLMPEPIGLSVQSEWLEVAPYVFILDGMAGFTWSSYAPIESSGSAWWSASALPTPSTFDRHVPDQEAIAPGDVTGDGIEDLVLLETSGPLDFELARTMTLVPGPLASVQAPVLDHPGLTESPVALGYVHLFRCGDVDGDGIADLCSRLGVDFGPPNGVVDVLFDEAFVDDRKYAADLDGDGLSEIYAEHGNQTERLPPPPGVIGPPSGTHFARHADALDPDGDGADDLYFNVDLQVHTVNAADFLTGTSQPTVLPILPFPAYTLATGDFDGDGVHEFVMARSNDEVTLYEQDGTPRLVIHSSPSLFGRFGKVMAAGDLDGDGIDDLILAEQGSEGGAYVIFAPLDCLP